MDSGNSGSLQSSSCGDDEYDSRASVSNPITTFMISNHQTLPNPPSSFLHHHNTPPPPPIFDPLSNYFDPSTNPNPTSLFNLDPLIWSKPDDINLFLSPQPGSSSSFHTVPPPSPPPPLPPVTTEPNPRTTTGVRNLKKRTRASRRAPTTVLTTDTTNFRAMVQEFTGIPAPPFSSSSPFPRTRLDLFSTSSSIRSNPNTFDNTPPPYLLRPFPHKQQPPPFINPTPPPPLIAGDNSSNLQNSFQGNIFNQTLPSSSFLAGLIKPQNSVDVRPASSNDHQFGQMSESMRDGSNYNGYSAGSFQGSGAMMNGNNATRGEGTVEPWICSSSD